MLLHCLSNKWYKCEQLQTLTDFISKMASDQNDKTLSSTVLYDTSSLYSENEKTFKMTYHADPVKWVKCTKMHYLRLQ